MNHHTWNIPSMIRFDLDKIHRTANGIRVTFKPSPYSAYWYKERYFYCADAEKVLRIVELYGKNLYLDYWRHLCVSREDAEFEFDIQNNLMRHRGYGRDDYWTDWQELQF